MSRTGISGPDDRHEPLILTKMYSNNPAISQPVIGVDIGGTTIRGGRVENGCIVKALRTGVPCTKDPGEVLHVVFRTISELVDEHVAGIGVGVPSVVDIHGGIVFNVENIPSWKKVHLKTDLENRFNLPVIVNNDANCFAIGERYFGHGRELCDFVGLVTGTGMGAGIIKNGHLLPDQNCGSGEFGIIPYLGKNLEFYCSGNFFQACYGRRAEEMALLAQKRNPEALEAFDRYGRHMGVAIKIVVASVDPQAVIIGGGVSRTFCHYEESMRKEIQDFPYPDSIRKIRILPSHSDNIAILGAAALCYDTLFLTSETG